jgi:Fe2+ transport system protein FeoA
LKVIEVGCTVNQRGISKMPRTMLQDMGIGPGDHVRIAYHR